MNALLSNLAKHITHKLLGFSGIPDPALLGPGLSVMYPLNPHLVEKSKPVAGFKWPKPNFANKRPFKLK